MTDKNQEEDMNDPHKALEWLLYYAEPAMRDRIDLIADALEKAERERDERLTRESGLALVEEANRWEAAYRRERDRLAKADMTDQGGNVLCLCCGSLYSVDGDCPKLDRLPHSPERACQVVHMLHAFGIQHPCPCDVWAAAVFIELEQVRQERDKIAKELAALQAYVHKQTEAWGKP